jgi:hypothetical protein
MERSHARRIGRVHVEPVGKHFPDDGLVSLDDCCQELVDDLFSFESLVADLADVSSYDLLKNIEIPMTV